MEFLLLSEKEYENFWETHPLKTFLSSVEIGKLREKKNWKVKVLNLAIHLVLILGATTMVYPLLLMISGSLKSSVDFKDFDIVPQYFYQDTALFKKYINTKYNTKHNW